MRAVRTANEQLADKTFRRQGTRVRQANWLAAVADRIVRQGWRRALEASRGPGPLALARAAGELELVHERLVDELVARLMGLAAEVYTDQAKITLGALPRSLVRALAAGEVKEARGAGPTDEEEWIPRRFVIRLPDAEGDEEVLFRPPSREAVRRIVLGANQSRNVPYPGERGALTGPNTWVSRLRRWAPSARDMGRVITRGIAEGATHQQITDRLLPFVDGYRVAAARVARTEVHRVNVAMQLRASKDALGPALRGWRYTAVIDEVTEPAHAERDGLLFKVDGPLPTLPSRPNCRCTYVPVVKKNGGMDEVTDDDARRLDGSLPDVESYAAWFNRQSADRKRRILGDATYERASKKGRVSWSRALELGATLPVPALPRA